MGRYIDLWDGGKDLTKITMPATINEPLDMLPRYGWGAGGGEEAPLTHGSDRTRGRLRCAGAEGGET